MSDPQDLVIAVKVSYPTEEAWLADRIHAVWASEAAALYEEHDWLSLFELWHMKQRLYDPPPVDHSRARWGRRIERQIAESISEQCELEIVSGGGLDCWVDWERGIGATPDFIARDAQGPVLIECKTSYKHWQGAIPMMYQVQVQQQMLLTGIPRAVLSTSFFRGEPKPEWLEFNPDFAREHVRRVEAFWGTVRDRDRCPYPPDGSDSSRAVLRTLHPDDSGEIIDLDAEWADVLAEYEAAREEEKAAAGRAKQAQNRLLAAIGDASEARIAGTGKKVTYYTETRAAESEPRPACKFRRFRVKKEATK